MIKGFLLITLFVICSPMAMACDPSPGIGGDDVSLTLVHDGVERSYVLHLPKAYDCETPVPMVIGLHGYTGTGKGFENQTVKIFEHVNKNGYIGVFPDGLSASPSQSWATGFNDLGSLNDNGPDGLTCEPGRAQYPVFENCPDSYKERQCNWGNSCADDLGFFRALIAELVLRYSVDSGRIYMSGFSQGGSSVNGLAASMADLLAAVAPLHGFQTNGYANGPVTRLPFMQVWGRDDKTVSGTGEIGSDGLIYETAAETSSTWAGAQGCSGNGDTPYPTVADGKLGWKCTQHPNCRDGSEVVSCAWDVAHHWPAPDGDNFAWDVVWDFFQKHQRTD